jgi:hypothetical protein
MTVATSLFDYKAQNPGVHGGRILVTTKGTPLNPLATGGLWLILPLGYLSLLVQGLLAYSPTGGRPETTIAQVRTRGR